MDAVVTIAALPVAALALWALLRAPTAAVSLVAKPTGERWHDRATPTFGGVAIALGVAAGVLLALLVGAVEATWELAGILAGCAIVFVAGLLDDVRHLSPLAKLAAQFAAAGIAIAAGLRVELVTNDVLGVAIALLWLVGITNAFNLLDNMDGLAATLAAIACVYFAIDAATVHENDLVLVLSLSLAFACVGFLPFNLRPAGGARAFMGDAGSQLLGFLLAALALASSWTTAGTTVATMLLPLLVLAIPILDTTLVTVRRLAERRPVTQGGKDHASHRLVYYGLSETRAVALLALIAVALGATSVAYNVLDRPAITALGVLVTFALLVQFGSFLSELSEDERRGRPGDTRLRHAVAVQPRRLVELLVDAIARRRGPSSAPTSWSSTVRAPSSSVARSSPRSRSSSARPMSSTSSSGSTGAPGAYATARDLATIALASAIATVVAFGDRRRDARPRRLPGVDLPPLRHRRARARGRVAPARPPPPRAGEGRGRRPAAGARRRRRPGGARPRTRPPPRGRRRRRRLPRRRPAPPAAPCPGRPGARDDGRGGSGAAVERGGRARGLPSRDSGRRRVSARARSAGPCGRRVTRGRESRGSSRCVGAYLLLSTLYAWQAWRRETPTIFTDELELTQLARSIAETGEPARRGEAYGFSSLVPWLTAPFWWLEPVSSAYEALKTVQAFVMAAAVFPAYLLARIVVTEPWAYFAAVATIAAPALSYAPILVEEPWAYPAATLALWLTVRAIDRPTRWTLALAVGACVLAVLIRSQLAALFGALAFGVLTLVWRTDTMRRWRATWTTWDWVGAVALGVGATIALVAFLGHRSGEWEVAATAWKDRMVEYGSWAGGAFAIGIGVLPAIALLALLAVPGSERARPGVRAFVVVAGGAVVSFGWYAAIKGAYLSTAFSSLIVERNLVYLTPLAFVATAYLLMRAAAPVWAVAVVRRGRARRWCSGCRSTGDSTTSPTTRRTGSRSSRSRTASGSGRSGGSRSPSSSSCSSRWPPSSPSAPRSARGRSASPFRWRSPSPCSHGT